MRTTPPIAVVGMACEFPEARNPAELWENVLARRRAFRRLPPERLRLDDYLSDDRDAPDRTYAGEAALLADYRFDRVAFRVSGESFRAADLAHWLALDVAARALDNAGFAQGDRLPRASTGVFLGNTLTGEFSRAQTLRLRWPYVRRTIDATLGREGWPSERRREFLERLEDQYKSAFEPVGPETLAGGLSNTIAGRICNHFDLNGGGYTIDGACASSLLAVSQACGSLAAGDLDVALAGGVDLSLDPFELVGFAKVGALAGDLMRVFDARSSGFWPGEGCGFVVLMRAEDAEALGLRPLALVRGWGVSSDGQGGLTRPEVEGQRLALARAYRRAGFDIASVGYFEGHGTGTAVGDATELRALSRSRRESDPNAPPAPIGSIKANIGHTKAAAGLAALIKAVQVTRAQILPPTTGCDEPHPELRGPRPALRVLDEAEPWTDDRPLRAGVSAMGFGGINVHVALEAAEASRRVSLSPDERRLLGPSQNAELFLFCTDDRSALTRAIASLHDRAAALARSELIDLAAELARRHRSAPARAAIVAGTPAELRERLTILLRWLAEGVSSRLDPEAGVTLGTGDAIARLGLLFPGQGVTASRDGGLWRRRFAAVESIYREADIPEGADPRATEVAQPSIVAASLAGLAVLERLGIRAHVAVGHSLGELSAFHWSGALDADATLRLARARGRIMAELGARDGAMASLGASCVEVEALLNGDGLVIAAANSPRQTVIAGSTRGVERLMETARARGIPVVRLAVSHAFHSPLVAEAVAPLAEALRRETIGAPARPVVSTITGRPLDADSSLDDLLVRQVTSPVRFAEALRAAGPVAAWIEVGPGAVLAGLAAENGAAPVIPLDAGGPSLRGLLAAAGAAHALGVPVDPTPLFADRFARPFDLERAPVFLANPCESAPVSEPVEAAERPDRHSHAERGNELTSRHDIQVDGIHELTGIATSPAATRDLIRRLVAERADLPVEAIRDDQKFLHDLHLNSISVSQLMVEAARKLRLPPPPSTSPFAVATIGEAAALLQASPGHSQTERVVLPGPEPAGIASWVRAFVVEHVERARPSRAVAAGCRSGDWRILATPDHPLLTPLRDALREIGEGSGVVVVAPNGPDDRAVTMLLEGARAALTLGRLVLVHHGDGAAAFARSLHREQPDVDVAVVQVPPDQPESARWIAEEARDVVGFSESIYEETGRRFEPILRLDPSRSVPDASPPLGPDDVLLVSGGGKGIGAECALALARRSGVRLALLGRSDPATDPELAANLRRLESGGVVRYERADVTRAEEVGGAVAAFESSLGPVTAILHASGVNEPRPLAALDRAGVRRTLAPKLDGLRNLLAAVEADRLRLLVTFGSVIARSGMRGQADYALANAWQTDLTARFRAEHPACRTFAVEWSVWSEVGMGDRLGRIEALAREGIAAIPPDAGADLFVRLVSRSDPPPALIVAGRLGEVPTLTLNRPPLPPRRFVERVLVDYPGVELVAEADLSVESDPYLDDHVLRGERLLPAVLGLEAMAQAVLGLGRWPDAMASSLSFEDVHFERPLVVPASGVATIRLAALAREDGRVEVALRCAESGFRVDHFRANVRLGPVSPIESETRDDPDPIPLDPDRDLYGAILFHRGRFRRIRSYRRLRATECLAEIEPAESSAWFSTGRPARLVLGDAAARDAAIHCVQACIPNRTLLPIGVDRIALGPPRDSAAARVRARERSRDGDVFTYDLTMTDSDDRVCERWEGLRLQTVRGSEFHGPWPLPLLGPYLELTSREVLPGASASVVVAGTGGRGRREDSAAAFLALEIDPSKVTRRADGKPERAGGGGLSAAHAGGITLAVAGPRPLACDAEIVAARPPDLWRDMLGAGRFGLLETLRRELGDDLDTAATRLWTVGECLVKLGDDPTSPITLAGTAPGGWAIFHAGLVAVATWPARLRDQAEPIVIAIATPPGSPKFYTYHHVVGFEESNFVGNVYFVNHLRWQGRCREMFLHDHAPAILDELARDLALVTTHVTCDYHRELRPFDAIEIRMSLDALSESTLGFRFEYRRTSEPAEVVATGEQTVACMRRVGDRLEPTDVPPELRKAIDAFG